MEQQKIEMLETMLDAEAKKLASCAVLLQSFWRGLIERRQALTLLALLVQKYKTDSRGAADWCGDGAYAVPNADSAALDDGHYHISRVPRACRAPLPPVPPVFGYFIVLFKFLLSFFFCVRVGTLWSMRRGWRG